MAQKFYSDIQLVGVNTDILLSNSGRAVFGDDTDLEIFYSNTSNVSFIRTDGTLWIRGDNLRLQTYLGEHYLTATENAGVLLYYDNSKKFETTSSGIDVTGTANVDNLTINGVQGTDGQVLTSTGSGVAWEDVAGGDSETAERIEVTVKNVSGGSLSKGTVVHAAPTATPPSGNVVEVIAADYDDATKMPAIGILNETIANEAEGAAVMMGAVSGIATSSFSVGDELYVGNNGALTNTKPATAGQLIQKIAVVIKSHASNGLIKIFGAGRSNDVPLPLYIDNTNQRVGISDPTPDAKLHITSTSGDHLRLAYSDGYYWDIARESADGRLSFTDNANGEAVSITPSGDVRINSTTSSPLSSLFSGTLVVKGAASQDPIIAITDSGTTNAAAAVFHQSSTSPGFPAVVINAASTGNEQPLISGRVGVSNTTGTGGTEVFKVDGDGDATFAGDITLTGGGTIQTNVSTGGEDIDIKAAGEVRITIDSNQNGGDDQYFKVMKHVSSNLFTVKETGEANFYGTLFIPEFIRHDGDTGTHIQMLSNQMILRNNSGRYVNIHANNNIYYNADEHIFYNGITSQGHIIPDADSTYDLGSTTKYWRNIYVDEVKLSTADEYYLKVYKDTVTINNSTYTTVATVNGNTLASGVRLNVTGTSGSVVIDVDAKIMVQHYRDILIQATSGYYRQIYIKIVSDNNEDFAIELKRDTGGSTSTTDVNVEIIPLGDEIVTFTSSHSHTGTTHEHFTEYGESWSSNDPGASGRFNLSLKDDGAALQLGASKDLKLYHDGSNSYIDESGTGDLRFLSGGTNRMSISGDVNVNGSTDLMINGTSRRINFTAGTGTVRTTTTNNLILQANSVTRQTLSTGGYSEEAGSYRAPIFYDSDNTGYYVNPNAGSKLVYLGLAADPNTSGGYRLNMGGSIDMNNNSIDYLQQIHFNDNVRFYDDGNNNYLNFKFGHSTVGGIKFYNGSDTLVGFVYANSAGFGLLDSDSQWAVRSPVGGSGLELRSNNNVEFTVNDDHTLSHGSSRAPIFYDSNNTTYYFNGADTSVSAQVAGPIVSTGPTSGTTAANQAFQVNASTKGALHSDAAKNGTNGSADTAPLVTFSGNTAGSVQGGIYVSQNSSTGTTIGLFTTNSYATGPQQSLTIQDDGKVYVNRNFLQAANSVRAPLFYDSDNTNRYVNPAGTSEMNAINTNGGGINLGNGNLSNANVISINDPGAGEGLVWNNGSGWKIFESPDSFTNAGGNLQFVTGSYTHKFRIDTSGNTFSSSSSRAPIFYDSDNTGYYINPYGQSKIRNNNAQEALIIEGDYPQLTIRTTNIADASIHFDAGFSKKFNVGPGAGAAEEDEFGFAIYSGPRGTHYGTPLRISADTGYVQVGDKDHPAYPLDVLGTAYSSADFRAPVFYDSDNTGYYVNPAGDSQLSGDLSFINGAIGSIADGASTANQVSRIVFPQGGAGSWDGSQTGAIKIRLPIRANNNMWSMKVRIYYYANSKSEEYFLGNYSYSNGGYNSQVAFHGGENSEPKNVRFGNDGTYDCVWIGETNSAWSYPVVSVLDFQAGFRNGNIANNIDNYDVSIVTSFNTVQTTISPNTKAGSIVYAQQSFRAPVFYDSDNTGYYVNPNGSSAIHDITMHSASATHFGIANSSQTTRDGIALYGGATGGEPTYGLLFTGTSGFGTHGGVTSDWATYFTMNNSTSRGWIFRRVGSGNSASISAGGLATFDNSVRSPIFYDSDNTARYINPAGGSVIYQIESTSAQASPRWDTAFYVLQAQHWYGDNSTQDMFLGESGNAVLVRGNIRPTILYDYNDTTYHLDPASGNRFKGVTEFRTNAGNARGYIQATDTNDQHFIIATSGGEDIAFKDGGVGGTINAVIRGDGNLVVLGDVIAYGSPSDKTLKENIKPLNGALDKVEKLQGVTFDWKEKDITNIKKDIGFIAQDVQKVLPELVRENDNGKLSMRHQGVIPVLVEAIKELKSEIEELKKQIK